MSLNDRGSRIIVVVVSDRLVQLSNATEQALAQVWDRACCDARQTWPDIEVSEAEFAEWVARRLPPEQDPVAGLASLRITDLYLAYGCVRGQTDALRAFERNFGPQLEAAARRGGAKQPEEVVARLRERLLVGPAAKLRDYAGTGSLARWLKIASQRLAIDMERSDRARDAQRSDPELLDLIGSDDPELQLLKDRYREVFKQAFAEAMRTLTPRARTMLRLHLVHGLTIDEIAPMHDVHRSTAARWLAQARDEVLERSRARLGELLETDAREVESILHLIASRFDVSIVRHLEAESDV
jgi:RNA polymerase sigma-70 factor (ECF subfamily)